LQAPGPLLWEFRARPRNKKDRVGGGGGDVESARPPRLKIPCFCRLLPPTSLGRKRGGGKIICTNPEEAALVMTV